MCSCGVGAAGREGLSTAMADLTEAVSSRDVGHHHLLPAAARLTSFFYSKCLLTTYHVEDTLLGTLRDTQE